MELTMPKEKPTWKPMPAGLDTTSSDRLVDALITTMTLLSTIGAHHGTAALPEVLAVNGFTRPARNSVGIKRPDLNTNLSDQVSPLNCPIKCAQTYMETKSIAKLLI